MSSDLNKSSQTDQKKKKFITRRKFFLTAIGAGLSATVYGCVIEPRRLVISRHTLTLSKLKPGTVIRILHMADFHYSKFVSLPFIQYAIKLGLREKPDFALITGDFVTKTTNNLLGYSMILKSLPDQVPTFASLGNHDGGSWSGAREGYEKTDDISELLKNAGIQLLYNETTELKVKNQSLTLTGLGDLWTNDLDPEKAFPKTPADNSSPGIVLSHNPDSKDSIGEYPWDVMFCGHTHGGQIRIPFIGTPFAPIRDKRYVSGLNPWKDRYIHTTCGVGNQHGIRVNSPPEISLITLKSE